MLNGWLNIIGMYYQKIDCKIDCRMDYYGGLLSTVECNVSNQGTNYAFCSDFHLKKVLDFEV